MDQEEAFRLLDSTETGLGLVEAKRRLAEFGVNCLTSKRRASAVLRFFREFNDPFVYILLIASVVTCFLGEFVDSSVIFGVVFMNALVGYLQETKSAKAIEALGALLPAHATVRREGKASRIRADDLVPGDVVLLQSGDRVPADLRLFKVRSLLVDESALTGESQAAAKRVDKVSLETVLAERANLAFMGTTVVSGQAEGLVWATGDRTETGHIAWLVTEAVEMTTPLTRKIAQFTRRLLYIILAVAVVAFAVGIHRGEPAPLMFMAAVALAVGAIPEGLPAAVTITLAIGVSRMALRGALIRKLPAVETIGSVTVICTDKTGTLTQNQMTVREIFAGGKKYIVSGGGYETNGQIQTGGRVIERAAEPALVECLKAGLLCNDAIITRRDGRVSIQGDPTEAALIVAAQKAGLQGGLMHEEHPRVDAIPFECDQMYRATLHHHSKQRVIYKVGALERLLERCSDALDADGKPGALQKSEIIAAAEAMARDGLRVLAMARKHVEAKHSRLERHHVHSGLTFLGLQGMIDPPRPEAIDAVRRCQRAGIAVKMITGDHLLTASSIARQIGLHPAQGEIVAVSGRDLVALGEVQLAEIAERASVFARVAPEDKLRLVRALQSRGHIVAMTGDGVNDAPALKQADIGVSMGLAGTDVAKGAADMILTDDNFATIEAAVEEGRGVFENLTKFILWTLPTNGGEGLLLLCAIFFGTTLPALPTQLLWVNMMTTLCLGLMLVFESRARDLMLRRPRNPREPILTYPLVMRTGLVTLVMIAGAFSVFLWELRREGSSLPEARTAVVNVIVLVEVFYLLNCRSLTHSVRSLGLFSNRWMMVGIALMIISQLFFTYAPIMNRFFHSAPIDWDAWVRIVAVAAVALGLVGFEKWLRFGRNSCRPLHGKFRLKLNKESEEAPRAAT